MSSPKIQQSKHMNTEQSGRTIEIYIPFLFSANIKRLVLLLVNAFHYRKAKTLFRPVLN
jgi:hypothetical protein